MTKHNPREEYGKALLNLARQDRNIVALDADLCKSTMSCYIEAEYPERFFEMGIAEQNMVSTAAGLSLVDKIPFVNTFAVFLVGRAYDQIRQAISIGKLNVKIVGSSAGLSDFGDGATHQTVEDVALMRAIPNMTVIVPGDAIEVRAIVNEAYKYKGPVYIRISRNDMEDIFSEDQSFEIGKVYTVKQGRDITIFTMGTMLSVSLKAAQELEDMGISAMVVNVSTLKPLDRQTIIRLAKSTGAVVTVEEHSVIGGLGSAIAEALRSEKNLPIEFVGIEDQFGQSSHNYEELLEFYGLTKENIAVAVKKVLSMK